MDINVFRQVTVAVERITIEQEIVNPNVFRTPPVDYLDQLLDIIYPYNILPSWKYNKITNAFGGQGGKACNLAKLEKILKEIRDTPDSNFVVEITLPKTDIPRALSAGVNDTSNAGEDEIENPYWPPSGVY